MALIALEDVTIGFRGPPLLDHVSCLIETEQRIGLVGRNGAGKTTLLRMLAGVIEPDSGQIRLPAQTVAAYLPQDVPSEFAGPLHALVLEALPAAARDEEHLWQAEQKVDQLLARMSLDPQALFENLSSGMKRRVLLARALIREPQLLLLDEPTNHLDLESIRWLENFLETWQGTLIFVTHDRAFLRKLSKRILEIDRGRIWDWSCDYDTFLKRKEEALAAEEKQQALFDKRLAEEEAWIRQGIKARRTRNEGRVRALEQMRRVRGQRRTNDGQAKVAIQEAARSGALVADVQDISFEYPGRPILSNFSATIMRGDKIGIIGPNGAGKTTFLKLLLGQLPPQSGKVRLGTQLQVVYFDQLRDQLDPELTVQENVGEGNDTMLIGGQRRHVIGYLQDFLFTPDRARMQVKFLSGGERNRVLLAKLLAKPANVLVLDEPTNDLDAETLEVLEQQLVDFTGTVLLVSHDRMFLNNVVGSTFVFEDQTVREYVGGYDDYDRVRQAREANKSKPAAERPDKSERSAAATSTAKAVSAPAATKKLGYKEQRELEQLPSLIEKLESEIAACHAKMADPGFYQRAGNLIAADQSQLQDLEGKLQKAYQRWEELEFS